MKRTYTEDYKNLHHGTTNVFAKEILKNGFQINGDVNSWCGPGIYFYIDKSKAFWAAKRKCEEINNRNSKEKVKPVLIHSDIININKKDILDLRIYKNLLMFKNFVDELLKKYSTVIGPDVPSDPFEKNIYIRSLAISFYCKEHNIKLVIGEFNQRPQELYNEVMDFAKTIDISFGKELIFCVKDCCILSNIH